MPIEITMPKLSDTMEEGTILRWLKREGEHVDKGEVLAEVETDKADMELEASDAGTLNQIRVKEGESAAVGAVLAVLTDGGGATAPQPQTPTAALPPKAATAPVPPPARAEAKVSAPPPAAPTPPASMKWKARDGGAPSNVPSGAPSAAPTGRHALSKLRLTVAKQMTASKRETPHFYVTAEIDMSDVARLRAALAASGAAPERITFTHFIIRALAMTLPRHPRINASWSDGAIVYHDTVNIGVAIAVDDGLIAPVIRDCQHLSLRAIARVAAELMGKAEANRFSGDELTGATFTISNMGMLDIEEFSAVITPPQAAILAVGSIKDRPVVRDGHLAIAKTVRVTLSVDHRVLNGVEAGRFLEDLKHTLENAVGLVITEG
ncbi:MAG TPA: dihydrolipoamide acetyltransferase family protein [Candidatus Acidoferrales bacterium]|nr:dihydrolipoamide acetyltransferase family protein [Candidatus Acidoferrales bacterium]